MTKLVEALSEMGTIEGLAEKAEDQAVRSTTDPKLPADYAETYATARAAERGGYKTRIAMGAARTQVEKLIHHMKTIGPISAREAMIEYHIASLTRRMCDIEELGYKLVKTERLNPVTKNPYTRYGLEDGPQ